MSAAAKTSSGVLTTVAPTAFVVRVRDTDAGTGIGLNDHFMAVCDNFIDTGGSHANAEFEGFYFFWYTDLHGSLQT